MLSLWVQFVCDDSALIQCLVICNRCHQTDLIAAAAGDNSLAIFCEDPLSKIAEPTFNLLIRTKQAHEQDVNAVAWNPALRGMLATCSDDGEIKVWQLSSDELESENA